MTRTLFLLTLLALAACGTSEAPPPGGAAAGEAPTVRLGGTFRAYYGNAIQ